MRRFIFDVTSTERDDKYEDVADQERIVVENVPTEHDARRVIMDDYAKMGKWVKAITLVHEEET